MILVYTVIRIELSEEKGKKNKTQNLKKKIHLNSPFHVNFSYCHKKFKS